MEAFLVLYIILLYSTLLSCALSVQGRGDNIEHMRKTHRVTQVSSGHKAAGPVVLLSSRRKHKIETSLELMVAAEAARMKSGSNQGTALSNNSGWLFPVTLGGSAVNMAFDTGSEDLWAFSTLNSASQRGSHKIYNPNTSGIKQAGQTFDVTYNSGSAAGVVYVDRVVAGSLTATADVGAATSVPPFIQHATLDGIMGFAFPDRNTCRPKQCTSFFDLILPQLSQPIFSVALKHNGPGHWDFGFIDKSMYTGAIQYTEQISYPGIGFWGIQVQGYHVGGEQGMKPGFKVLVDTGTTLLLLPNLVVIDYYANVPGAAYDTTHAAIVFPCSSTSSLPPLTFHIGGQDRTMPGAYGRYANVNATYCFGGVQSSDEYGVSVLGDIFLKSQYVVFHSAARVVGFAQQKGVTV